MKCWKIDGNYYSKSKFKSYNRALEASKSNIGCFNCLDCVNCSNCVSCKGCEDCVSCVGLSNCSKCIATHRDIDKSFNFRGESF